MKLYDYQVRVARLLRNGKSVILQAPTGSGKTMAALWPFIEVWDRNQPDFFPRQCIYSVPMRVLANQFLYQAQELINQKLILADLPSLTVQTGERPEDRELEGDIIFTTIDQTLSNFLNVPYALSSGKANVNAGAIVSSYLVFDEFHLFPYDGKGKGALPATIQMLRLLRYTTPFILMTATFSEQMLKSLAEVLELDYDEQVIVVPEKELRVIDTRWEKFPPRQRQFHLHREQELLAAHILSTHQTRSLAVCNTVDRATTLFDGLLAQGCRPVPFDHSTINYAAIETAWKPDEKSKAIEKALQQVQHLIQNTPGWQDITWVMLLHARFEQPHRSLKEEFTRRMFSSSDKRPWLLPSLILAATQVIEVGLDLTCERLHTEIAPANSVLQRAGRCARFPGERGHVHVYEVPFNKKGERNTLPYPFDLCKRTWEALNVWDGEVVDFTAEQKIVNQAHGPSDQTMLQRMKEAEGELWQRMADAVFERDVSARPELIRNTDSRTVLVYEPPIGRTEESPYHMKGFSIYHGTLRGKLEELKAWRDTLNLDWCLKYPHQISQEENSRDPAVYQWLSVERGDDISASLLFAVHPQLVAYDALRGFRFVSPDSGEGGRYYTPIPSYAPGKRPDYTYQLESYPAHIQAMIRLYESKFEKRLAYIARQLEGHPDLRLPPGSLDRAICLAIALHDVGKLQVAWQAWARNYQAAIGGEVPNYLIAHTHSETDAHRQIEKTVKPRRPHHAGEGAMAGLPILGRGLNGNAQLTTATLTAIARHHSPNLAFKDSNGFKLHPRAKEAVSEALAAANCDSDMAQFLLMERKTPVADKCLLGSGQWTWWLIYFLVVRMVRLTDGESQERQGGIL